MSSPEGRGEAAPDAQHLEMLDGGEGSRFHAEAERIRRGEGAAPPANREAEGEALEALRKAEAILFRISWVELPELREAWEWVVRAYDRLRALSTERADVEQRSRECIAELKSVIRHPSQLDDDESIYQAIERVVRHFYGPTEGATK